jgi:hypothetical protein
LTNSGSEPNTNEKKKQEGSKTIPKLEKPEELVLKQYERCAEDLRYFDKLVWELPFATATVIGAILAVAYGEKLVGTLPSNVKIPLLCYLLIFVTTSMLVVKKVRFFSDARTEFARYIEGDVAGVKKVPVETRESIVFLREHSGRDPNSWLLRYRAIHFQYLLYASIIASISFLLWSEGPVGILGLVVTGGALVLVLLFSYDC